MIDNDLAETRNQATLSLSGDHIKDCRAIAGTLSTLYLIVKQLIV